MNANRANPTQNSETLKHVELAVYAILALCLIGHLFYVDSQISAINVGFVASGILFGLMVAVGCTPVSRQISTPGTLNLAEVFTFSNSVKDVDKNVNDRRAA